MRRRKLHGMQFVVIIDIGTDISAHLEMIDPIKEVKTSEKGNSRLPKIGTLDFRKGEL